MTEQIENAMRRVRGYWFVEGFVEMAAGGLLILLAALILFRSSDSPATFSVWFLALAGRLTLAKLGGLLVALFVLWWLKDHFTYPRTGFMRGQPVTAAQVLMIIRNILLFLLLPILGLLAISLLLTSSNSLLAAMPAWFPVGLGALWAVLLIWSGEWMGLRRFRVLAALTLLAGIGIGALQWATGLPNLAAGLPPSLLPPAVESLVRTVVSLSFLTLACGVILVVSGFFTFLSYRKENPEPYAEEA